MRRLPTSWISTLAKLGLKRAKSGRHTSRAARGRRSTLEMLESRELLTNSPWQGADLAIADFNGDGNVDRLSSLSASSNAIADSWSVDTRGAASTGQVENWHFVGATSLPSTTIAGDFNGDGRTDLLARWDGGPWKVIESRGPVTLGTASAPIKYDGEFVVSSWGITPTPIGLATEVAIGDFNGDGRDDLATLNSATGLLQVARSTDTSFTAAETWWTPAAVAAVSGWSLVASVDSNKDGRDDISGDFNGDGRTDILG